ANLKAHICNLKQFEIPIVVCLNQYQTDTEEEIKTLKDICAELQVSLEKSTAYVNGGEGAISLAKKVLELSEEKHVLKYQYELEDSIEEKLEKLAKNIYHANGVCYSEEAKEKIERLKNTKYEQYPICVAKTQYSLSDDPNKLGNPTNYELHVKDIRLYAGAKFITILLGDIMTMPGLPKRPNYEQIDVIDNEIIGLF
ncbi:MAG: formate--tetrahydrofolate ligase, partial [Bacilli bacterium]|nr:formate--tetrahydrofolate ligase [Bacilli bacterium]